MCGEIGLGMVDNPSACQTTWHFWIFPSKCQEHPPIIVTAILKTWPPYFWNTYRVIASSWRTTHLAQCRLIPQFSFLLTPIPLELRFFFVLNPQPYSYQCLVVWGCRTDPVLIFLGVPSWIDCSRISARLSSYSKDHTNSLSSVMPFMDHERVLLVHLGNCSLHVLSSPYYHVCTMSVLTGQISNCQQLWVSAFSRGWAYSALVAGQKGWN